jgi:hypothetical protein
MAGFADPQSLGDLSTIIERTVSLQSLHPDTET